MRKLPEADEIILHMCLDIFKLEHTEYLNNDNCKPLNLEHPDQTELCEENCDPCASSLNGPKIKHAIEQKYNNKKYL